jgi:hypothetical protein
MAITTGISNFNQTVAQKMYCFKIYYNEKNKIHMVGLPADDVVLCS